MRAHLDPDFTRIGVPMLNLPLCLVRQCISLDKHKDAPVKPYVLGKHR
jgi:hypothetical protein